MNKEDLYRLLGEVDEKFIEEAKTERISTKKVRWFPALAAAAVLVVCLLTGSYVWRYVQGPSAQGDVTLARNETSADSLSEEQEPVSSKAGKYTEKKPEENSTEQELVSPVVKGSTDTQVNNAQGENEVLSQYQDQSSAQEVREITENTQPQPENPIENSGTENMGENQSPQAGTQEMETGSTEQSNSNGEGMPGEDMSLDSSQSASQGQVIQEGPAAVSDIIAGSTITFQNIAYGFGGVAQAQQVGQALGTGTVVTTSGTSLNGSVYEMAGTDSSQSIIVQADNDSGYYYFSAVSPFQDGLFEAEN